MGIVLQNAVLVDFDPPGVERGALRVAGGVIAERGAGVTVQPGDQTMDCGGAVVLPGLVNGHTHLYSALAVGMPAPSPAPESFLDILRRVWWRLDRALDCGAVETSARVGALEAVRCGTTTLIDHHASPNFIDGALDAVESGVGSVGPRAVLCYETTDRHGHAGAEAGLRENERYLKRCATRADGQFAALVGAHASFTLEDDSLDALASLAEAFETGVHIHVAEDACDEVDARRRGTALIDRLADRGLLRTASVLAHGTHLAPDAIERVNASGATLAHNPRSNMNNAVGHTPVDAFAGPVMLGTDGIGADMFAEARAAWWIARHCHTRLSPDDVRGMLAASARRASAALGVTLGRLSPGSAGDVVVTDYRPPTPLTTDNLAGHVLFGLASRHVRDVMIGGRWVMRDRRVETRDEAEVRAESVGVAKTLWHRMGEFD